MNNKAIEEGRKILETIQTAIEILEHTRKQLNTSTAQWSFIWKAGQHLEKRHKEVFDEYFREPAKDALEAEILEEVGK